jgi:hypothetical protein
MACEARGIAREVYFGSTSLRSDRRGRNRGAAIGGAEIVDRADIPSAREIHGAVTELTVLLYEFKAGLNAFLAGLDERASTFPGGPNCF